MAYQQKDNTGSLFKNDRKESDNHPDYKGTALVGGVEHWLDAWINETGDGRKYMSLKLKPKEQRSHLASPDAPPSAAVAPIDTTSDSVPF